MIRRNITFDDGKPIWLLISQVEHARISGELTRAWREPFSVDVLEAITHHDDGWAKWEAAPQFDVARGRPRSFTELDVADAIKIWDGSIASARRFGPLAGAIVAGHFSGLASGSEHASQPPAAKWLERSNRQRAEWLHEWSASSGANTPEIADRAQQMLFTADLFSLWLCMNGPVSSGTDDASASNSEMQSRTSTVLGQYTFRKQKLSATAGEVAWRGSVVPWPFAFGELNLEAPALAVPAVRYESWPEIAVIARPVHLRWLLRETLPGSGEC